MAERVQFISKYISYLIYVGGRQVQFVKSQFVTEDPTLIQMLKGNPAFGTDYAVGSIKGEPEPKTVAPQPSVAPSAPAKSGNGK